MGSSDRLDESAVARAGDWIDRARIVVHHSFEATDEHHRAWTGVEAGRAVQMSSHEGGDWQVEESTVRQWATGLADHMTQAHAWLLDRATGSEAKLPPGLALPTEVLISTGEAVLAGRYDLVDELVRPPGIRYREAGRWSEVPAGQRAALVTAVHRDVHGHLRLTAWDRTAGESRTIGWLLHRDGWRDLSAGAGGVSRLVRNAPGVLADRLAAALTVLP